MLVKLYFLRDIFSSVKLTRDRRRWFRIPLRKSRSWVWPKKLINGIFYIMTLSRKNNLEKTVKNVFAWFLVRGCCLGLKNLFSQRKRSSPICSDDIINQHFLVDNCSCLKLTCYWRKWFRIPQKRVGLDFGKKIIKRHVYVMILSRTNRSGKPWVTFNVGHPEEKTRRREKGDCWWGRASGLVRVEPEGSLGRRWFRIPLKKSRSWFWQKMVN